LKTDSKFANEEIRIVRRPFGLTAGPAVAITVILTATIGVVGLFLAGCNSQPAPTAATPAATQPATPQAKSAAQLSPSDIKEMKARDDYATNLSKTLHLRMPAYKNVKIYADNWLGSKAPGKNPLNDIKDRKGDNLNLVFWSPDAGTARGLADFTKSPAVQEAIGVGFEEFQFVDPDSYCYAQVVPPSSVGAAVCGIR
jgi:hypothetical protein